MDAFVSYSRRDAVWVDHFEVALVVAGVDPWLDRRKLTVALPWLEEVKDGIERAAVLVRCRSPHFEQSENCASEVSFAQRLGVRILDVEVGSDPALAAHVVADGVGQEGREERAARMLLGSARTWERRGRPRRALLSARENRRLRSAARPSDARAALVEEFVVASQRRLRVRSAALALGALVLLMAIGSAGRLDEIDEDDEATTALLLRRTEELSDRRAVARAEVYEALEIVAGLGGGEAAFDASPMTLTLDVRTPVDAFDVPSGTGLRFAYMPVGDEVAVLDSAGNGFVRSAAAIDVRLPAPADVQLVDLSGLALRAGGIEVASDGELERVITLERHATLARRSPDRRMVAAMGAEGVDVYDVETGRRIARLEGVDEQLHDIAWSDDSSQLWGSATSVVVSWRVRDGTVLIDDPGLRFRTVLPSLSEHVWVLEEAGRLLKVDPNGRVDDAFELGLVGFSAEINTERSMILVSGADTLAALDLGAQTVTHIDLSCSGRLPVFVDEQRAVVSCDDGLAIIDVGNGRVAQLVPLPFELTAQPVAYVESVGLVMISVNGTLARVDEAGASAVIGGQGIPCAGRWSGLAVSANAWLHPYGQRVGQIGCNSLAVAEDSSYRWQAGGFELEPTYRSRASAFGPAGDIVLTGLADGSVVAWPSGNITPQRRLTPVSGDIFDLEVMGSQVYVVTRTGMLAQFLMPPLPSNELMAGEAMARLAAAETFGLYGQP
ncbi:MAG: TIR domain-containing protein [Actinomycetota bacterium]